MLETKCVGDDFGHFSHQHPLSPNISVTLTLCRAPTSKRCHQDLNSVANILKLSPTVSHQNHSVTNTVAPYNFIIYEYTLRKHFFRVHQ